MTHARTHAPTYLLTNSPTHSLTYSLTHLLTHSLTYSLTRTLICLRLLSSPQVDELLCSCCTMIAVCKLNLKHPLPDDALAASNEALEIRPTHSPALYRRSQVSK